MMPDSQIDELFNERLRDYRSSVPADMWDRIARKKKRDRNFLILFFKLFGLFILTLGLAGEYFIFQHGKKETFHGGNKIAINHGLPSTDTGHAIHSNLNSIQPLSLPNALSETNGREYQRKKSWERTTDNFEEGGVRTKSKTALHSIEPESGSVSSNEDAAAMGSNKKEENEASPKIKSFSKSDDADSMQNTRLKKPAAKKPRNERLWYADIYASPDLPIASAPRSGQMGLSHTVGIRLNRSFGKHFSGKIGIQFSQINYKSEDSIQYGDSRHLKSFDLPVLAGYTIRNEKFRMTLNAGVVLNLYSWFQGGYSSNYFKTNTGLSFYAGIDFEKGISKGVSIFGEPYYRYRLTSMTSSTVDFNKFIDVAGLSIGMRYHFKK